jgi:hypothetical protein
MAYPLRPPQVGSPAPLMYPGARNYLESLNPDDRARLLEHIYRGEHFTSPQYPAYPLEAAPLGAVPYDPQHPPTDLQSPHWPGRLQTIQYAPEQPAPQDLFAPPTIAPPAPAQAAPAVQVPAAGPLNPAGIATVPAQDTNLADDAVERTGVIVDHMMGTFGLTHEQAAGVAGNLLHESDQFQGMHEYGQPADQGGIGWAQWTDVRRDAFEAWAAERGLDVNSDEANLGFLDHELLTTESAALEALRETETAAEAARVFEDRFERAGVVNMRSRLALTEQALLATADRATITPQSSPALIAALQNTLVQSGVTVDGQPVTVDGIWGPQTEQAFAALQSQQQQVLAATEAYSPTAPMIAPQMTEAAVSPNLVADALPVSPATDRAYAPPSSGLPQAAQAIQDASPVLPAMEGAVLNIAPVAPPMAAERPMPSVLSPAADYGIGIPSAPQPQELQPVASFDLEAYDPNVPIEQQIAPQSTPDQRLAEAFASPFPMMPVEQAAALPANPAPPEAMAAPFGQIMQGPFDATVPGGTPPEATAALPAPAASQLTPDVRVEQGFGFDPQPIADWELVERAFLAGHPNSILQPDQAPPVDMVRPAAPEIGAFPAAQLPAEDYTTLSPLQPQTDFGFVPDYQTIATTPPPQVAAPVAPDFATLSPLAPDATLAPVAAEYQRGWSPEIEPTLAAPVPPSAIDAPYLGGYELPAPGVGSLQFSPEANLSLAPSVPAPAPLTPSVTSVQTTSFAPESIPFQPGAFTPPTMQFEQPYAPPAPPAPPAIQVVGQDAPTAPTGAVAPDIQTIDPPEATEPPTPLSLDAIASQAGGFGATGLPSVVAARTGPGIGNFLGAGIGAIATTALGAGPIPGAMGGWRAGGWLGNQFGGPPQPQMQPPPQPRPVFNPFNGQFMGYDTSGQDGGDGYGGSSYGSGGFTGSYPGMGHYSGPNPSPSSPNYGYHT